MFKILFILLTTFTFAHDDSSNHQISFQTIKNIKVDNDLMLINMQILMVKNDIDILTKAINEKSQIVKNILKKFNVKFKTTNYNTHPQYHKNKIQNWRGNYSFSIESKDFKELIKALKKLQKIANYQSISFLVSTERRQQFYTQLLEQAITYHRNRAKKIATNFGFKTYKFKQTNFNNQPAVYPQLAKKNMSLLAYDNTSTPSFTSGKSTITIIINSTIELN